MRGEPGEAHQRVFRDLYTLDRCDSREQLISLYRPLYVDIPWGSSVMSSAATCPSLSFVAWTCELNPFAILFADWPMLRLAMPVWRDFQLAAMSREGWFRYTLSILATCEEIQLQYCGDVESRLKATGSVRRARALLGVPRVLPRLTRACTARRVRS